MQTEHLKVTGMSCGGCTGTVTRALKAVNGVADADVSLSAGEAIVQYDEKLTTPGHLKSAIEAAGYGVSTTDTVAPQSKGCCCGSKNASAPA
jgi:copper chaperone